MDASGSNTPNKPKPRRSRLFWKIGFAVVFSLLLLEGALRLQQIVAPGMMDLELKEVSLSSISDELNHVPAPDGVRYDEYGLKNYSTLIPTPVHQTEQPRRILFLGDSFMQGLGGKDDLAWHIWDHYQQNRMAMMPYSAGHSSYSPAIFIPQSRRLIPHVKPHQLIVVIDNTDMADDGFRYDSLLERDDQGRIVRVRHTPVNLYSTQAMIDIRSHSLYIARWIHKLYVTKHGQYAFGGGVRKKVLDAVHGFIDDSSPDAAEKCKKEIAIFERNLRELADVLIEKMGRENVMWVCHPQPHQFTDVPGHGRHHRLVPLSVAKIAAEKQIHFYDSTSDLAKIIGTNYQDYYLDDGIYHFNPKGIGVYARCIYEHLPATWKQPLPAVGTDVTSR